MNDITEYLKIRPLLQTGDPLLFQSHSLVGSLIRKWTNSGVNHTGMVIRFPAYEEGCERIFVIEALGKRLEMNALSERLKSFKGRAWWLKLRKDFDPIRDIIGGRALYYVGTDVKYDYMGCVFGNMFGRAKKDKDKLFCSEALWLYIEEAVARSGDEMLKTIIRKANRKLKNEAPTPGDFPGLGIHEKHTLIL